MIVLDNLSAVVQWRWQQWEPSRYLLRRKYSAQRLQELAQISTFFPLLYCCRFCCRKYRSRKGNESFTFLTELQRGLQEPGVSRKSQKAENSSEQCYKIIKSQLSNTKTWFFKRSIKSILLVKREKKKNLKLPRTGMKERISLQASET